MKKIILALATLLFMGSAATKAQVTKVTVRSISGNSKEEVENIDNAKYRITYEGKWVNNPSIKPFIYTDSEMRLDIGEKATSFYDRTKQVKDSLMNEKAKTGNFDFSDLPKGGRFPFSYYKNYPSTGKSIQLESVGTTDYKCTERGDTRLATHPRQRNNHHRLSLPTSQDQLQGKNLVCMVRRRHSFARRSLEADWTAGLDTESIR